MDLSQIYQSHYNSLLFYTIKILGGNTSDAEDAVQDAFIKFQGKVRSDPDFLSSIADIPAYLAVMCRNEAMNHKRKEARIKIAEDATEIPDSVSPETTVAAQEQLDIAYSVINSLDVRHKKMWNLWFEDQLTFQQIAKRHKTTRYRVERLIGSIKAKILMKLEGEFNND